MPKIITIMPAILTKLFLEVGEIIFMIFDEKSIAGTVPIPKNNIVSIPSNGFLSKTAFIKNAYTNGHGKKPLNIPRINGDCLKFE
jgi:hypothetical protein